MEREKLFHEKHPWIDRLLHFWEDEFNREYRRQGKERKARVEWLRINNPKAYEDLMDRQERQLDTMRRTGSTGS